MLNAQNNCSSSIALTDSLLNIMDSSGVKWFKFQTNSGSALVDINDLNNSVDSIILYDGSCNNLYVLSADFIEDDNNIFPYNELAINTDYYLKIVSNQTANYTINAVIIPERSICIQEDVCNMISNGNFEELICPEYMSIPAKPKEWYNSNTHTYVSKLIISR